MLLKSAHENEKVQLNERLFKLEKDKMQWNIERKIMFDNKTELEEKYNQIFSKINNQQRELESLKKPPYKLKDGLKDSAKHSIKDLMNKSGQGVLGRNILGNLGTSHSNSAIDNSNSNGNGNVNIS